MIASRERQHGERVSKLDKNKTRILPITAIFGGNASGKTNFFKALSFVKTLVVIGTRPESQIPVDYFRLDDTMAERPSSFCLTLLINEVIYEFSLALTRKAILEEKLVSIYGASVKTLYNRHDGKIEFDSSLDENQFLKFVFQGTRDNQLFLTNSVYQKVSHFQEVYNWFNDTLELIAPDSRFALFERFLNEADPLHSTMNEMLSQLDTGIAHIGYTDIPFESLRLSMPIKTRVQDDLKEGMTVLMLTEPFNEKIAVTLKDGQLIAKKLVTFHPKSDGTEAMFEINQESDGSLRVIDLLPAFLGLSAQDKKKVFVIDDIDRSLHTLLTSELLEEYLDKCSKKTRTQLLLTTHDALLIDQNLLRRDEIWVVERDYAGASNLFAFSEYKDARKDKNLRKSYLQGRMGGVPRF
jgi:AAA15 family ATPase/GTPase